MSIHNPPAERFFLAGEVIIRLRFEGKLYHSSIVLTGQPTSIIRAMPVSGVEEITADEAGKFLVTAYGKSLDEARRFVADS